MLRGPAQRGQRAQIEAALFGDAEVATSGRYRLLDRLGEGGMGVVYAAYDEHLARKIALKLIRPGRVDSAEVRERTLREARALARLSHPNVVHVYEAGELEGQLFVAMEFLAGPTLRSWQDAARRPWREVLRLFCQAGEGLAAAHAEGIVHRDFKPHNAMLGADGRVRVLDFGLARFSEVDEAMDRTGVTLPSVARPGLTLTGAVVGTPAYMAPEQFVARNASERSDQFSFCVALFEALYGYRPFQEETLVGLVAALHAGRVADRPADTAVPQRIHAVLLRGLQADPGARWPSMRACLEALARDPGVRLRWTLAVVSAVAITGSAGYTLAGSHDSTSICPDARVELAEVWGEGRAAAIREEMRERHGANGDEVLALVEPQIERYAARWSEMRNEACLAHAEGRQSAHVFDLRTACLDQRRAGLDAVVAALETASTGAIQNITKATSGLPALERCEDTRALLAAIALPEDPALQERVQAHRETLARVQVSEDAGEYKRGLELVDTVLVDSVALSYEPLLAEAYLYKGSIEMYYDAAEAARSLERAMWAALAVGHAPVAAQASSKRGFVHAARLGDPERARADLPMIAALNRRVVDDIELYAEFLNNVGAIHFSLGDWPEARRWEVEARDLRAAHAHPVNWRSLATLQNLARLDMEEMRLADALAGFRDVIDANQVFGPKSARIVVQEVCIVTLLLAAGRPREAHEVTQRLLNTEDSQQNPDSRLVVMLLQMKVAMDGGELAVARRHLNEIRAFGTRDINLKGFILSQLSLIAALEGDAAAMEAYERELSAALAGTTAGGCKYCSVLDHGRALEALGRVREAIGVYEKMLSELGDSAVSQDVAFSADASLALGRAHHTLGDEEAAERELLRALTVYRSIYPVPGPTHARALVLLGELALTRQRWDEARVHLTEAVANYAVTAEPDFPALALARFALAQALTGAAAVAPEEARGLAQAALQALTGHGRHAEAAVVESWLAARTR